MTTIPVVGAWQKRTRPSTSAKDTGFGTNCTFVWIKWGWMTYIHTYMHACMHACMHVYIVYIYGCIHIYIHMYPHTHTYIYIWHTYMYIYIYMSIYLWIRKGLLYGLDMAWSFLRRNYMGMDQNLWYTPYLGQINIHLKAMLVWTEGYQGFDP